MPEEGGAGPRTLPSALRLSNNRTQDPDEQLPDTPWQFFFWGSAEGCKFEGDWCLEGERLFPNDKAWTNKPEAKVIFEFEGSEVRVPAFAVGCQPVLPA